MELSLKDWCSNSSFIANPTFHLFGIVMHSGMTSCSGHYQAYVKVPKSNMADVNNNNKQSIHQDNTRAPRSEYGNKVHSIMESSHLGESQSFSSDDNGTSVGFNTSSSDDKYFETNQISSPQSSAEKARTTCISGFTRYFHKSRKHSTKETKLENHEEKRGDLEIAVKKKRHHSTPTFSVTGTEKSLNKIQSFQYHDVTSSKTAIRKLNFQDSKRQPDQATKGQNASGDEEIPDSDSSVQETQAFQWIHFDDAEVAILEEADVSALLSSSESSFTSPYLLFYKLAEPWASESTV